MDGKEQKNNMECIIQRENKTEISDIDFNEKINQNQTLNEEREKLGEEQQRQAKNLCQRLGEISPNDDNIIDRTGIINNDTEDLKKYDENHFINFCGYKRKLEKSRPSRIKIKEDKNGEQYVSIQIKPGDLPEYIKDGESKEIADGEEDDKEQKIKNERDELQLQKENDFKFNETFKYKFSFKIPENFLESPTRLIIGQRKFNRKKNSNEKKGPNPILAQKIQKINGKYFFIVRDGTQKKKILGTMIELNDIKGKWVDMEYEIKLSDRKRKFVNRPTRSFLKVKAKIEGGKEIQIYNGKLDIEKTNNLILNPETPHSGYFKFGIYRDNYDYTLTKNLSEAEQTEINQAKDAEINNPMEILFKNFSMENLSYREREHEKDESKQKNGKQAESYKTLLNDEIMSPESTPLQLDDEIDSETVNPESASQQLYNTKEKVDGEKDNEIKHVEGLILRNDIEGILKYLGLDKNMVSKGLQIKTINFIGVNLLDELESITSPKDIFNDISKYKNDLKFLEGEKDIINETQNEYNKLYNKLIEIKGGKDDLQDYIFINLIKKVFKNLKRLKNSNKISRYLLYKKITKDIVELKYALRVKRKDVTKYLKRLNEYEKGEYIDFPNGITFELGKGPEKIYGTNINIGENEFYIKTDIGKNGRNKKTKYIEYVDSLKKARKLFEKKGIKLRYCQRCTWLANREFIEAYEKERQKRKAKEGIAYEKTNRLKVLEQTEDAVISYRHSTEGKSPIRFIDKDENGDLFEFAQKNKYFGEAEMWLDLDKL